MIGLDVETAGHNGGGALSPDEGRLRLVQVAGDRGTVVLDVDEEDPRPLLEYVAARDAVAHNANFEELWAREYGVELTLEDTMVMSRVLYGGTENFRQTRHSLQDVVARELGEEITKDEQTSDWSARPLSAAQIEYAKRDAEILPRLAGTLYARLHDEGLFETYRLENRVRPAVDAMERRGVAVHVDALDALIQDATAEAEWLKSELAAQWGINPGSSKQLIEHFALDARMRWPRTPGGAPKTNQDAMKRLVDEYPSVGKWIQWKEVEKIRSTYGTSIRKRLSADGRLRARFNAFGTATGRFSSSDPNLQNIPKRGDLGERVRGLFWSGGENRVLIKADYASIELWLAAILWEDPYMQDALAQDVNMHVATAASLFNVPIREVTKGQKATGKIVNFALLYGGSPRRILQEFTKNDIPIDSAGAEALHQKFYMTYKGFARRKERARQAWNDWQYRDGAPPEARTPIGRRRNFGEWYGPFLNHEIQGAGADGIKTALARMHEDPFPDAYPVLTVHDEIVVEAPRDRAGRVEGWVEHHMVEGMLDAVGTRDVPSRPVVEIETGREWS